MPKINHAWKVQRHGAVEEVGEGIATVAGTIRMPLGEFPRRMTVVRLSGGRSAVWSPIPLHEPDMRRLERLGVPAFLLVPGIAHRLDIAAWKARYPEASVLCPPGARKAVEEAVKVDATTDAIGSERISFMQVAGTAAREAALLIRRRDGTTLVLNDLLANVRRPHGLGAQVMARLMRFEVDRPRVPWTTRRMLVDEPEQLAEAFRLWAEEPGLARIIVSHGDVISDEPARALRMAAEDLG